MNGYIRNRDCPCVRCRAHSLMGAVILITLGVIFLFDRYHVGRGGHLFPILFVVIGCMLLIQRTGSMEGHVNPGWQIPPPTQYPQQWTGDANPTPPPPTTTPAPDSNDQQVKP